MVVFALPTIAIASETAPSKDAATGGAEASPNDSVEATVSDAPEGGIEVTVEQSPAFGVPAGTPVVATYTVAAKNGEQYQSKYPCTFSFTCKNIPSGYVYIYYAEGGVALSAANLPNHGSGRLGPFAVADDGTVLLTADNGVTLPATFSIVEAPAPVTPDNPTPENPTPGTPTPENPTVTPDNQVGQQGSHFTVTAYQPKGKNTSSTSPQTGVDFSGVIAMSIVALGAAAGVGYVLRRKLAK